MGWGGGGGENTEIREESAQKGDTGEENFPTLPPGTHSNPGLFDQESGALPLSCPRSHCF